MLSLIRHLRPTLCRHSSMTAWVGTGTQTKSIHQLSQHVDTPENNQDTFFDFTVENYKEIDRILKKYPKNQKRSAVIPVLFLAQKQNDGWLPLAAMKKVAKILDMAEIRVYEVASFYTMFNRVKVGTYHVQVCTTTPCALRGAYDVLEGIKKHLGIEGNQTTKDGLFTLSEVECLGACTNAPMMQVSASRLDEYYEDLTVETANAVLDQLAAGGTPKVGPQNGRVAACGIEGKTTLLEEPTGPVCRDLDALKRKLDEEASKQ